MPNVAESSLTVQQVRERLKRGDVKTLATRTGRTQGHVSQVLSGLRADRKVAVALARMWQVPLSELPAELYAA
jgi:hypothetical protein